MNISTPPALLGILILLLFVLSYRCVPKSIGYSSSILLRYMSLFFIPAIVAVASYTEIIFDYALALMLAIVVATIVSMMMTALLSQWLMQSLDTESVADEPVADLANTNEQAKEKQKNDELN